MRKPLISSKAPAAIGPYSHGFKFDSLVFTSGQLGLDPKTGKFAGASVEEQTKQAFENLIAVLEEGGSKLANVIKITVFLKNMDDFAAVNKIYGSYFTSNYPARTCIAVAKLPMDALIEIEAIGYAD
jgi:2-iminobutanoate/2-iminopropanoate deaminase